MIIECIYKRTFSKRILIKVQNMTILSGLPLLGFLQMFLDDSLALLDEIVAFNVLFLDGLDCLHQLLHFRVVTVTDIRFTHLFFQYLDNFG